MNILKKEDWRIFWEKAIKRDVVTTRIFFDPLAAPLTMIISNLKWITPNLVTAAALIPGLISAYLFFHGNQLGGALAYYVFFLLDSIDGKLARLLDRLDPLGAFYDFVVDRVVIGAMLIGMMVDFNASGQSSLFALAIAYLYLFYLKDIFDLKLKESRFVSTIPSDRLKSAVPLARWKLHFKPGQLVSGFIVFFLGPITGWLEVCFVAGIICVMFSISFNVVWPFFREKVRAVERESV